MYWSVFIIALFVYGICHLAGYYRIKAVESGESKLGFFEPGKCPFCRRCKLIILATFVLLLFTAYIIVYSNGRMNEWDLLLLSNSEWKVIHAVIGVLFSINFLMYMYIHTEAVITGFKKILHIK